MRIRNYGCNWCLIQCCGAGPFLTGSGYEYFFIGSGPTPAPTPAPAPAPIKKKAFNHYIFFNFTPSSYLKNVIFYTVNIRFLKSLLSMWELKKRISQRTSSVLSKVGLNLRRLTACRINRIYVQQIWLGCQRHPNGCNYRRATRRALIEWVKTALTPPARCTPHATAMPTFGPPTNRSIPTDFNSQPELVPSVIFRLQASSKLGAWQTGRLVRDTCRGNWNTQLCGTVVHSVG